MKYKRESIIKVNSPMQIALGVIEEKYLLQSIVYQKGSIVLPHDDEITYTAKTEVILNEITLPNIWYHEYLKLKLENLILKEKDIEKRYLLLIYHFYIKSDALIFNIPSSKKVLASYLDITLKELSAIEQKLKGNNIVEIIKGTIVIKDLIYIENKLKKK